MVFLEDWLVQTMATLNIYTSNKNTSVVEDVEL